MSNPAEVKKLIRDESNDEARKIWRNIDEAAQHAPEWVIARVTEGGNDKPDSRHRSVPEETTPPAADSASIR